ncbi:hypothetical protein, partial [Sphingomonas sp. DT-207]|uniref:hypothetical protein n=1 Tax=Sphingomonas sp. DT-207 TaxID=3396167 RepID=UPI003F540F22
MVMSMMFGCARWLMPAAAGIALFALLVSVPASADPVSLRCRIKGPRAFIYGGLSVMVDLKA